MGKLTSIITRNKKTVTRVLVAGTMFGAIGWAVTDHTPSGATVNPAASAPSTTVAWQPGMNIPAAVQPCNAESPAGSPLYTVMAGDGSNAPTSLTAPDGTVVDLSTAELLLNWINFTMTLHSNASSGPVSHESSYEGVACIPWGQLLVGKNAWVLSARIGDACWIAGMNIVDGRDFQMLKLDESANAQLPVERQQPSACGNPSESKQVLLDDGSTVTVLAGVNRMHDCIRQRDLGQVCNLG